MKKVLRRIAFAIAIAATAGGVAAAPAHAAKPTTTHSSHAPGTITPNDTGWGW
ncbi:hypothetical protein GCM10028801_06800 [Nocardioides maradonensis]